LVQLSVAACVLRVFIVYLFVIFVYLFIVYFRKDKFHDAEHMLMLAQAEKIRMLTEQVSLHAEHFVLLFLVISFLLADSTVQLPETMSGLGSRKPGVLMC